MAGIKEIRDHIKSVQQTLKITNAMYLISSSNLRKARKQLTDVEPYFLKIESTIADILYHSPDIHHSYFDPRRSIPAEERKTGYVVITGDKGLAGAYNHNVLKLAEEHMAGRPNTSLFVVGQAGRNHFVENGIMVDGEFLYTAQDPTMPRARDMAEFLIQLFLDIELDEIYVVFTQLVNPITLQPTILQLLPLSRDIFPKTEQEIGYQGIVNYVPSVSEVMDHLVPGYLKGVLFGALVESFCAEQHSRMTAMKASSDNAREMLRTLSLDYNRARQSAITQEITEIVGGAQAAL